jgi:acyl-CoA synthetase (AMP-forming)/AMP-acid ligase II
MGDDRLITRSPLFGIRSANLQLVTVHFSVTYVKMCFVRIRPRTRICLHPYSGSACSVPNEINGSVESDMYTEEGADKMLKIRERTEIIDQPAYGSLYNSLRRWARTQPEASFIIEAETGNEITYAHTLAAVNMMRLFLGDAPRCIILALPSGLVNAVIWISALTGGHQLIPLSPGASDEEIAWVTRRYRPDVLFVERREDVPRFACPAARVITRQMCDALIKYAPYQVQPMLTPLEGRVCLATSGTTGESKSVILSERQIAWTADHVRSSHQLSREDRGLTVLPFFHVNAPVVSLCSSLLAGSTVVIAQRFSSRNFWLWIERYQITWASIVPTIVAMLLRTEMPDLIPSSLHFVRTGSAPLPAADLQAFEARFDIPVIETYGLSEAASQVVANPLPPGIHKPGSAGLPVGVSLRICSPHTEKENAELRDVPQGENGEICIAGPAVIHAYHDNVGNDAFQDGWFRTGDLGYLDEDGYLFITGRLREVINRGGENIAPREIEEVLLASPLIQEAAVVGRPDPIYGEQVVAYIVVQGNWNSAGKQALSRYVSQHLSQPKVPIDFIVLDALPKNATGKVERRLLRAREQARATCRDAVLI